MLSVQLFVVLLIVEIIDDSKLHFKCEHVAGRQRTILIRKENQGQTKLKLTTNEQINLQFLKASFVFVTFNDKTVINEFCLVITSKPTDTCKIDKASYVCVCFHASYSSKKLTSDIYIYTNQ